MAAVRRPAVVMNAGVLRYHGWENTFVDVSSREVGIPEIARLVGIVKLEVQRFGESVIYPVA